MVSPTGSEFRSHVFGEAVEVCGATQRRIKAGRPNANGYAERVQLAILEECWRSAFSHSLPSRITAQKRGLGEYLATTTSTAPTLAG